jgi:putative CocE/NonD family hydrolase
VAAQQEGWMEIVIHKSVPVAMRDGVVLATDLYRPAGGGPFPALLMRLPYGKDSQAAVAASGLDILRMVQAGYALVVQDCRGRFASGGVFSPFAQEAADGADTLAWAAEQPWSNGSAGMLGGSYLGAAQWLAAAEQPPALRAIAPAITASEYHDHWVYQGGALQHGFTLLWSLSLAFDTAQRLVASGQASPAVLGQLMQSLGDFEGRARRTPLTDAPDLAVAAPYYAEWLAHPDRDGYWDEIAASRRFERISTPALHVGGWFDIFLGGTLASYRAMRERGAAPARDQQRLIVGPWSHGNTSGIFHERDFGLQASADAADLTGAHLRWFERWLKGGAEPPEPPVSLFVMGADAWRAADDWPLPEAVLHSYYLHSGGRANTAAGDGQLSTARPNQQPPDSYRYDPRDPLPTLGGATFLPGAVIALNAGPRDQRPLEARPDLLVYTTPPLERDLLVIGPIEAVLFVSSSAPDTDFTARLLDVAPGGAALLLTDGILRARYRSSAAQPELMVPGAIYELRIVLGATANLFRAGHSIRLEVSSSNFPRFDRNGNTGGVVAEEREEAFVMATNQVYHDAEHPSRLILPIVAG